MGSRVTSLGVFTISKHTISVADRLRRQAVLFSGLPPSGLPGRFHHPCLGMARAGPSRSIGPLPGGSKFFKVITGFKFLAPCIANRASKSAAGGISRYRCHRCAMSCCQGNRACTTVPPPLSQRSWSTGPRFTPIRRWTGGLIRMIPAFGLRSSVVPEFPAGQSQGPVCRSRFGRWGRFGCWGTMPQPGWPWGEAASSCNSTPLTPSAIPPTACGHD